MNFDAGTAIRKRCATGTTTQGYNNADLMVTNRGSVLLPKTPETFFYDADGNLTSDGVWTNTWNAENRLISTENAAGVPAAARMKEQWTYLPDGRWIERVVSKWNGSTYAAQSTNRFVWDGQVLLAVLDHTNGLIQSYLRGLDLSGSLQGGGGVGGLLALSTRTNGNHFYCFDGNGNVMALVNASDGSLSAQYEYGPFAEPLRATGPLATENFLRFSSQFSDEITGDVKYLFREYTPSAGRWRSRDPIGEEDTLSAVAICSNDLISCIDPFGLWSYYTEAINSNNSVTINDWWFDKESDWKDSGTMDIIGDSWFIPKIVYHWDSAKSKCELLYHKRRVFYSQQNQEQKALLTQKMLLFSVGDAYEKDLHKLYSGLGLLAVSKNVYAETAAIASKAFDVVLTYLGDKSVHGTIMGSAAEGTRKRMRFKPFLDPKDYFEYMAPASWITTEYCCEGVWKENEDQKKSLANLLGKDWVTSNWTFIPDWVKYMNNKTF